MGVFSAKNQNLRNYCGSDEHGFAFYGRSTAYKQGHGKRYGEAFKTGDVIRVMVDMDKKRLFFAKNGKDLGMGMYMRVCVCVCSAYSIYPSVHWLFGCKFLSYAPFLPAPLHT